MSMHNKAYVLSISSKESHKLFYTKYSIRCTGKQYTHEITGW